MMDLIPEVKLGNVLISMLEAEPGEERKLNRWYERDHFYSGCMMGANFFSGRRYIATRQLKDMRFPRQSPITEDVSKGSFLTVYWILDTRYEEALDWSIKQVHQLHDQTRMGPNKTNISSGFYQYDWGSFRDEDGVPAEVALEHPYKGLAMSFIDSRDGVSREDFESQCKQALEAAETDSPCAISLCLRTLPLPDSVPSYVPRTPEEILRKRYLLLHFFEQEPASCWRDFMNSFTAALETSGCADTALAAAFLPTIPGTDTYVDQV